MTDFSIGSAEKADNVLLREMPAKSNKPSAPISLSRTRLFWTLQIAGWVTYGLTKWINALALGKDYAFLIPSMCSVIIGFFLTLGIRAALKRIWPYGFGWIMGAAMPLVCISAIIFSAVDTFAFSKLYEVGWTPEPKEYLGIAFIQSFVLTSWVGLYVGIKYYAQYRLESERVLKITATAHQAQLAMLRYQLNPHFLFNTLNAISTLVMDNQAGLAARMLDKLSAFLRYSLVTQPTDKVTLVQEVDALNLYLDIEKVRFEDRLKVSLTINDDAKSALVPSLLLQPLIENAIKYAVAPSENGGSVTLTAKRDGAQLLIDLCDDGPGIGNGIQPSSSSGSGVGLANTRERLKQIYKGNYEMAMRDRETGGLCVTLTLPFERAA